MTTSKIPAKPARTPAWRVCNKLYDISVPKWFFRDQDYQDEFGLIVSGDRKHDNAMIHELIPIRATALELAKWLDEGLTKIHFADTTVTPGIYTDIKDIMDDWIEAVPWQVGLPEVNLDLMKQLDRFADHIYKMARRNAKAAPRPVVPSASDRFRNFLGGDRPGADIKTVSEQMEIDPLPERPRLIDRLEENIHKRSRGPVGRRR